MFHSLLIIWHSQAADFKFHRSVNTPALSKSPAVRASHCRAQWVEFLRKRRTVTGEIPDSHRWDSSPKIRFALDAPLEGVGFELLVPRYNERSILEISSRSRCRLRPGFSPGTLQDDRVPSTGETP